MDKLVLKDIKIGQIGSPNVGNNTSSIYNVDTAGYIDFTTAVRCSTTGDCPKRGYCHEPLGGDPGERYCICVHSLKPVINGSDCSRTQEESSAGVDRKSVVSLSETSNFKSRNTDNSTQQTDVQMSQSDVGTPFSDIALKVFLPLGSVLVLSFIILLIVLSYRYLRNCKLRVQRRNKRGKNSATVKASEDIQLLDKMNVVNRNPAYFGTNEEGYGKKLIINDIPVNNVTLLQVIGEGAFGQVYKGELAEKDSSDPTMVAVKVLKEGVSNEARDDFEREVEIMSAFDHDNILKLLGTVSTGNNDTPYMVFEYMMHGDLTELLRKNDPTFKKDETSLILQKMDLVDITIQIANGMRYLTSQHFVHRDLATRNCLVGDSFIVKISDFGMSRDIYTCDYYKIGGSRMLPVRWMSPEAVKWGRFTTDSDIWAFGVVLWEIFSYGRQPYYGHTNEEVIKFLDEGILLQRPEECPSIVYHVMLQCWKLDPKERLAFDRIHKYLTEYSKQLQKSSNQSSFDVVNEYEIPL